MSVRQWPWPGYFWARNESSDSETDRKWVPVHVYDSDGERWVNFPGEVPGHELKGLYDHGWEFRYIQPPDGVLQSVKS